MHRNRPSVRSRESSSSISIDNRGKVKECCRKTVAFMCTQVGVGGLIVVYALVGALSFIKIETNENYTNNNHIDLVNSLRKNYSQRLWEKSEMYNIFNMSAFKSEVNNTLAAYQKELVKAIKMGWNGQTPKEVSVTFYHDTDPDLIHTSLHTKGMVISSCTDVLLVGVLDDWLWEYDSAYTMGKICYSCVCHFRHSVVHFIFHEHRKSFGENFSMVLHLD